jgi:hypothetical protein
MEVHTHTHTARKKWTHYLWEFLMLFLAVFCGFLAENQREHMIENRRRKQYMQSMIKDLKADTALINRCIHQLTYIIDGHDSLEYMLENKKDDEDFLKKLYYYNTAVTYMDFFVDWTQGTFEELKSSGNLRLITSKRVREEIQDYETLKQWAKDQHIYSYESIMRSYYFGNDIFDITCFKKYNDFLQHDFPSRIYLPYDSVKQYMSEKPRLFTDDKVLLKKYLRLVNNEKSNITVYKFYLEPAREKAIDLIHTIEKEYQLQ